MKLCIDTGHVFRLLCTLHLQIIRSATFPEYSSHHISRLSFQPHPEYSSHHISRLSCQPHIFCLSSWAYLLIIFLGISPVYSPAYTSCLLSEGQAVIIKLGIASDYFFRAYSTNISLGIVDVYSSSYLLVTLSTIVFTSLLKAYVFYIYFFTNALWQILPRQESGATHSGSIKTQYVEHSRSIAPGPSICCGNTANTQSMYAMYGTHLFLDIWSMRLGHVLHYQKDPPHQSLHSAHL